MIWKVMRPQYWILDRSIRTTNRAVVIGLILVLLWGGEWIYKNLILDHLALLSSDQVMTIIASSLPMALMLMLVFALLGLAMCSISFI